MRASPVLLLLFAFAGSCGETDPAVVTSIFDLEAARGENFFDMPWPSDLRLTEDGTPLIGNFPNRARVPIIETYKELIEREIHGFSLSAPVYFRFDGPIDTTSLPESPEATVSEDATVFLINIDPDSPDRLQRLPAAVDFVAEETLYWPGNTLTVRPIFGMPLRDSTTYAAVITTGVRDTLGNPTVRSPTMSAMLGFERPTGLDTAEAAVALQPAVAALSEAGVNAEDIVSFSVFTTQDATSEMLRLRDHVDTLPAPELVRNSTRFIRAEDEYQVIHGAYISPQFMDGEVPFITEGGAIRFDEDGTPIQQGEFEARFAVTVPNGPMPEAGWPIILYAHGTGGNFEGFVGETARRAAEKGFAVMGVDQIHHGPRNPTESGPELLVFNFVNPNAFRNNTRQSAIDLVAMARFAAERPLDERAVGPGVFFDPSRMYFFGHSQGGINGPLFLAIDDQVQGAVLSGASGTLAIALVEKTEPLDIPSVVAFAIGVADGEAEQINFQHPTAALLAITTDVSDPALYAHMWTETPRPGFAPKHILMTQGLSDPFTPPRSCESLATAGRVPIVAPVLDPFEGSVFTGVEPVNAPVMANSNGATTGLIQYAGGHFVAFEDEARTRIFNFLESAAAGTPTIE